MAQTVKTKVFKLKEAYDDSMPPDFDWADLSAQDRRMLVARWVSDAWRDVVTNSHKLIAAAFVETGFLVAKDASENSKIKLWKRGDSKYTF